MGEAYGVLGIEGGFYRLIDDLGDPVLFEPELFELLNDTRPSGWVSKTIDGDEYAGPPEFAEPGFSEDFHEREPQARAVYARYLNRHLDTTDAA